MLILHYLNLKIIQLTCAKHFVFINLNTIKDVPFLYMKFKINYYKDP